MIPAFFSSARMILLECHESPALLKDKREGKKGELGVLEI
jgi:hypothetical protein